MVRREKKKGKAKSQAKIKKAKNKLERRKSMLNVQFSDKDIGGLKSYNSKEEIPEEVIPSLTP